MFFELRTYKTKEGRLQDLVNRFENPVIGIWKELGIDPVGFWTSQSDSDAGKVDEFVYLLRWDSEDERKSKMDAFLADPRWIDARDRSEANGKLVDSISTKVLSAASFS